MIEHAMRISAPRLDLVPMSPAFLDALLRGRRGEAAACLGAHVPEWWPDEHDEGFLRLRLKEMRDRPQTEQWLVRALVDRHTREMIGHAGFHGPPGKNGIGKADALEVGYTVFPAFRRRGFATEAVSALIDWARSEHGVHDFIASIASGNEPSLGVVRKLGFVRTGKQWDEEHGHELVFQLSEEGKGGT
jgi:[ribosomal protein S5]-alanine N-acetyltransferase